MRRVPIAFSTLAFAALIPVVTGQTRGVFVTPIPNAPLLAVVTTELTQVQSDGTTLNEKTLSAIARDGKGRIFNERRPLVAASDDAPLPILSIHIYDPQTRENTFLRPENHVALQSTLTRPPAALPPETGSIPLADGSPRNPYVKEEDLGLRKMEGVDAHGFRVTETVPAEANGGHEIAVVDEYWYSAELRLNMLTIHKDPRTGEQTTTVTQVSRGEPDAAIFEIPPGYQIVRGGTQQQ